MLLLQPSTGYCSPSSNVHPVDSVG